MKKTAYFVGLILASGVYSLGPIPLLAQPPETLSEEDADAAVIASSNQIMAALECDQPPEDITNEDPPSFSLSEIQSMFDQVPADIVERAVNRLRKKGDLGVKDAQSDDRKYFCKASKGG